MERKGGETPKVQGQVVHVSVWDNQAGALRALWRTVGRAKVLNLPGQ